MAEHYSMFDNDPDMREMLRKLNEDEKNRRKVYRQYKWMILFCIVGLIVLFLYVISQNQ